MVDEMINDGWQQTEKTGVLSKWITVVLLLAMGGVCGYSLAAKGAILGIKVPYLAPVESAYQLTYSGQPRNYQNVDFDLFWGVWDLLNKKYYQVEDFDNKKMLDGAIAGMVASLGDPYTMYIPSELNKISEEDLSGSFGGIGVEMTLSRMKKKK